MKHGRILIGLTTGLLAAVLSDQAQAELKEIKIAQGHGISFLNLTIIEKDHLLEKYAKAAGLGDIKVTWLKFGGANVMNEALLSDSLQIASGGVSPFVTLWAKTHGAIKAVSAINSIPIYLNTRNPKVKTIKDFTDRDKIALPAVKVSNQAVMLQMAAAKTFGQANYTKLDALTVSLSHPDAMAALLSGKSEITAHFTAPPYQEEELKQAGVHRLLTSYEVLGGPTTFNLVWASQKFHDQNPKLYAAFVSALQEATDRINWDKHAAAVFYKQASGDKGPVVDMEKLLKDPNVSFTMTPQNVTRFSDFLYKVGSIKTRPASWKDLFFTNAHRLKGS